jgi:AhpD family alkylhydroperoxidase
MEARLNGPAVAPDLYRAVAGVERYLAANVDPTLYELIKLRASIVNGCAFCVDMHSTAAMKAGEHTPRLFGLAAWRETPYYTEAERAALALTDEATELGPHGVTQSTWDEAARHFDDKQLADVVGAIAMINFWNRWAISFGTPPASGADFDHGVHRPAAREA